MDVLQRPPLVSPSGRQHRRQPSGSLADGSVTTPPVARSTPAGVGGTSPSRPRMNAPRAWDDLQNHRSGPQLVMVGDSAQAIYGWCGVRDVMSDFGAMPEVMRQLEAGRRVVLVGGGLTPRALAHAGRDLLPLVDLVDEHGVDVIIDDAEARLVYVAVTRARHRLDIGGLGWINQHPDGNAGIPRPRKAPEPPSPWDGLGPLPVEPSRPSPHVRRTPCPLSPRGRTAPGEGARRRQRRRRRRRRQR